MMPVAAASLLLILLCAQTQAAAAPVSLELWRLDCGAIQENDLNVFSDTYAYVGQSRRLAVSCYLIQHGDTYMLWDTGLPEEDLGLPLWGPGATGESLTKTLAEQLRSIGVERKQIARIGISHYDPDHTGQAKDFPQALLMMGKQDVEVVRSLQSGREKSQLSHWIGGPGKLEAIVGDRDVFGDQTVVMLDLPGHTPGHHGLLVKLAKTGYVLLSGDVAHFRENYETDGVPSFNTDRLQTLASLQRFKAIARNLHATVIIQHDERDIAKLAPFPAFAD
jgi:N-acyl homoserine lactone hydrolase